MIDGYGFDFDQTYTLHMFHSQAEKALYQTERDFQEGKKNFVVAVKRALGDVLFSSFVENITLYSPNPRTLPANWKSLFWAPAKDSCVEEDWCPNIRITRRNGKPEHMDLDDPAMMYACATKRGDCPCTCSASGKVVEDKNELR
jgi:hypothetical protein